MTANPPAPPGRRSRNLRSQGIPLCAKAAHRLKSDEDLALIAGVFAYGVECRVPCLGSRIAVVQKGCKLRMTAVHAAMPRLRKLARPASDMRRFPVRPVPE